MLPCGDSFLMLADTPSEAIQLTREEPPPQRQQQQQQQDLMHTRRGKRFQEHEPVESTPMSMQEQLQQRQLKGIARQQTLPSVKLVVPKQLYQTLAEQQQQQQVLVQGAQQSWLQQQQQQDEQPEAPAAGSSPVAAAAMPWQEAQHLPAGQGHTPAALTPAALTPAAAAAAAAAAPVRSLGGPVMLMLVGLPGSGKSTFAAELLSLSCQSWVRVNQDTIRGGRRGTRQQCMAAAKTAMQAGSNVIVDRCNIDASQRSDFIQLAQQLSVDVHCVVLNISTAVCMNRAAARINHEGGVQGKGARRIVGMMAGQYKKAGPPSSIEGFSSLNTCTTPEQVAAALQHWAAVVGSTTTAPSQPQQQQVVTALTGESSEPPLKKARVDLAAAAATISRQQADPTKQQQQQHEEPAAAAADALQLLMPGAKRQQQQ